MTGRNSSSKFRNGLQVIATEPFQRGYTEFRTGVPFCYDAYSTPRDQVRYERGRFFAQVDVVRTKKLRVCTAAVGRFNAAALLKEIV